jgi:hypothetical protein
LAFSPSGAASAACCPEYIEDHDVANAGTSAPDAATCDCLIVFVEKQLAEKPHGLGEPSTKENLKAST